MTTLRPFSQRARLVVLVSIAPLLLAASLRAGEIHDAAAAGDLNKVKTLLAADPTLLESKDSDGNTPLISACFAPPSRISQVAVANQLIDQGANINARNRSGGSPVYFALRNFDLMQRLIAKGADVNVRAYGDLTVLHQTAAFTGDLEVAKLLIEHGADVNARSTDGTILHWAIQRNGTPEMVTLLVKSGAQFQRTSYGNTELHLAALMGATDLARTLVHLGADVSSVNEFHHTALYYAAKHGYRRIADVLMAAGADEKTVGDANYGKAPQLAEALQPGEAYLWSLGGGNPGTGYAVKTKGHLLLFDPSSIDDSPEAGLANGHLNQTELAGQRITVLHTRMLSPSEPGVPELAQRLPGADFVLSYAPTADNTANGSLPPYRLAAPHESFSVGDLAVHTVPAIHVPAMYRIFGSGEGLGYLVETDGLKIFHAGLLAARNDAAQLESFRKEVDFLKPFGPIDVVILPVKNRHLDIAYEPYLYLLDTLAPRAVYLIGDNLASEEHKKCVEVLRARGIPVAYPEGGMAVGARFHFLQDQSRATPTPATHLSAQVPAPSEAGALLPSDRALVRDLLRELVEIDTTPANGSTKAAVAMAERLHGAGFSDADVQLLGPRTDRENLVVRLRGRGKARPILLIAHLDVVSAPSEGWSSDPFHLTERDGVFYGRGVSDVKNGVAVLVANLIRLHAEGFVPDRDLVVALTADEEAGNANGIAWLLATHRELMDVAYCLNLDSGGGQMRNGHRLQLSVQTSEKTNVSFRAEATSPGGHSSMPGRENAIYRLAVGLARLAHHEFPFRFNETTRAYFDRSSALEVGQLAEDMRAVARDPADLAAAQRLGSASPFYNAILHTTAVATRLEAGHADNAIPQSAHAIINCRVFPGDSLDFVRRTLSEVLADPTITLTPLGSGRESPVSPLLPEVLASVQEVCREMWPGVAVIPTMDPWASDSALLRRAGIPTFGLSGTFGERDDSSAHGANEHMSVESFHESNQFLHRLLILLTAGAPNGPDRLKDAASGATRNERTERRTLKRYA